MKTSIEHLPDDKQRQLQIITETIPKIKSEVEMIILFGSYARRDWVAEKAEDGVHYKYHSDFDILLITPDGESAVIMEASSLRGKIRGMINTPLSLIAHGINCFNKKLEKGEYFFVDIWKEGICLFDAGNVALTQPKELSPIERRELAQEDYDYWFTGAMSFYKGFKFYMEEDELLTAAFQLHQVTERLFAAILLVFTHYKPNTHDLEDLNRAVNGQAPECLEIFPQHTKEEKHLFELLRQAYVGARYKKNYRITRHELEQLQEKVDRLKVLAETLCAKKIDSFVA